MTAGGGRGHHAGAVPNVDLLHELEPTAARLFDRHLAATKEWFPHELVPYHRARDFAPGEVWAPAHTDCGGVELSAAFANVAPR